MSRETLPSGAWVEFQDGKTATEGQRRPLRKAGMALAAAVSGSVEEMEMMVDMTDLAAATMITAASFLVDTEKCSVEHITGLLGVDYDALIDLVAVRSNAFLQGVTFDPSPDPKALTVPLDD